MMRSWKRDFFSSGRGPTRILSRESYKFEIRVEIIQDYISRREANHIEA
jgi:hypothetical protein